MSFLNLMRNRLKPKEVNDALTDVQGRVLPVTTSASTGQILGLTGEDKTPAWVDESSELPDTTGATTGQILGLTGENKTPAWVDESSELPDTTSATTGQVLGLTGENKTPAWVNATGLPNYSTSEQNTGIKWIDGRDVYSKTFSGNNSHDKVLDSSFPNNYEIIHADAYVYNSSIVGLTLGYFDSTWRCQVIYIPQVGLTLQSGIDGGTYNVTIYYVKPAPAAKTKKTTK